MIESYEYLFKYRPYPNDGLTREVLFYPSYDDTENDNRFGIGSMLIDFVLKGNDGCASLKMDTGWFVKSVKSCWPDKKIRYLIGHKRCDKHSSDKIECIYTDTGFCEEVYLEYGTHDMLDQFISKGTDYIWGLLKDVYDDYIK